jgi:hypothetical protein
LHTESIEKKIKDLNAKPTPDYRNDPELLNFSYDKLINSNYHTYILKPFKVTSPLSQSYANVDTVYSEPVLINGISWRLKVYPNGNGTVKGIYLSVFVEMYKGWSKMEGSYDYRIELVNRLDHSKVTSRQHVSEFETSVSWGYNRFIKLDQLEKENYLDPTEDLLEFRFYINPSNEMQLLNDLTKYIESLESTVKEV